MAWWLGLSSVDSLRHSCKLVRASSRGTRCMTLRYLASLRPPPSTRLRSTLLGDVPESRIRSRQLSRTALRTSGPADATCLLRLRRRLQVDRDTAPELAVVRVLIGGASSRLFAVWRGAARRRGPCYLTGL